MMTAGCALAATPADELATNGKVVIRFQPASTAVPDGMLVSDGSVYSPEKGFGWDKDLRDQARDRGNGCTGVALIDRAITDAVFAVDLPDGGYLVNITAWDTDFPTGLTLLIDGKTAFGSMRLKAGDKGILAATPFTARSGRLQIALTGGTDGYPNSMIHEISIIPASAKPETWRLMNEAVQRHLAEIEKARIERQKKHLRQRGAYRPVVIEDAKTPRQTIDLCGDWLFRPAQEAGAGADPGTMDANWHVLGVPQFWNPIEWWIYSTTNGTSHNYIRKEIQRCEDFTFDYRTTDSGWYRQWINVPASMKGRRFVLRFDAVASFAEVYWNGQKVGSHVGMFAPFEVEVTDKVKFGEQNLLAVLVGSSKADPNFAKDSVGVAVTVNITKDMLNSLPHGWYKNGMAGIWQPVSLEITGKGRIDDVYFQPTLDSAVITTSVSGVQPDRMSVVHTLTDAATGKPLEMKPFTAMQNGIGDNPPHVAVFRNLKPKLWSPEHPNLYRLKTQLLDGGKVVDEKIITVGFKTFEAKGDRLYLNGKPYFLRGADMPPHGLEPNNKALAEKFMKLMHDGNEMVTRFHMAPPSKIWLDAADKYGVGASVGETWPWVLMGDTPIPDERLMEVWREEFCDVVRANRNHPSLMLWTVSNESYFEGSRDSDKERQTEKYRWFSRLINDAHRLDPKTPVVLHSGYVRHQGDYDTILKPNNLNDGDVDDKHAYFGWYSISPFHLSVAKHIEEPLGPRPRPIISQEASTGYPDQDTGHPVESYIRDHFVPQAWVGKYGTFNERPDMFLETHGQITKEYAEKIRRDRTVLSGWMLFANCCWFKDVYDPEMISPYPAYHGVKLAHQPVLVSLALHDRHFEAGQRFTGEVVIVHDDPDRSDLNNLTLRWHIFGKGPDWGTSGSVPFPGCKYDGKSRQSVEFIVPTNLYTERAPMTLELTLLQGDEVISRNEYPLIVTTRDWYAQGKGELLALAADDRMNAYMTSLGFDAKNVKAVDWFGLDRSKTVVVGPGVGNQSDAIKQFVMDGGRVLVIQPDEEMLKGLVGEEWKTIDASGDFVEIYEDDLLAGMDPMDMHWWNALPDGLVRVCSKSYQMSDAPGLTKLAQHIQPHSYLRQGKQQIARYTSWPVVELKIGEGRLIISSALLADDPLARRFTANLVNYLMK